MISFRDFRSLLLEKRFESEHTDKIREIASKARTEYYKDNPKISKYGDCDPVSMKVADDLKREFPKHKVVVKTTDKFDRKSARGKSRSIGGHTWVEMPEIGHVIDPTYDQTVKVSKTRKTVPRTKTNLYGDNVIKITHSNDPLYKSRKDRKTELHSEYEPHRWERVSALKREINKMAKEPEPKNRQEKQKGKVRWRKIQDEHAKLHDKIWKY